MVINSIIIPLRGSILQAGTCQILSLAESPRWSLSVAKCAASLLEDTRGPLIIESVHCLTKDPDPRTKCWRVVVPPGFKDIMENSLLYPEGWRYREFVGIFRNSNQTSKKIRMSDGIVDQVMAEVSHQPGQGNDQLLHSLHQQVMQLVQQQASGASGQPLPQSLQG